MVSPYYKDQTTQHSRKPIVIRNRQNTEPKDAKNTEERELLIQSCRIPKICITSLHYQLKIQTNPASNFRKSRSRLKLSPTLLLPFKLKAFRTKQIRNLQIQSIPRWHIKHKKLNLQRRRGKKLNFTLLPLQTWYTRFGAMKESLRGAKRSSHSHSFPFPHRRNSESESWNEGQKLWALFGI